LRARANPRCDDLQGRIADSGREHGQIAGGREIDGARALRFEKRRCALEVGPAKRVRRAVEYFRGFRERTRAAGLIAEHDRGGCRLGRLRAARG